MTVITKILESALPKVGANGWSQALTLGIRENNLSDQACSIFPRGPLNLVEFWLTRNVKQLANIELKGLDQRAKVKELLAYRLANNREIGPFLGSAQDMLLKSPTIGTHHLAQLSDEIWWLAGDRSTDSVWYTRRGGLGVIYAAAETMQRFDKSTNFRDTIKFINKQVDRHFDCETMGSSVLEWAQFNAISAFNVARSLTR